MCSMAAFCQRLRGTQGDVYALDPSSVSLTGSGLTAKLANTKSSAQFNLQLTSYEGTVRLHIDEEPSQDRCVHCSPCLGTRAPLVLQSRWSYKPVKPAFAKELGLQTCPVLWRVHAWLIPSLCGKRCKENNHMS